MLPFDAEAAEEVLHAVSVIDEARPGWGVRFLDAVYACVEHAATHPESGEALPGLKREVRRFVVRRFPYVVLIANIDGERRVIAVMHGHQAPSYWRGRVR